MTHSYSDTIALLHHMDSGLQNSVVPVSSEICDLCKISDLFLLAIAMDMPVELEI